MKKKTVVKVVAVLLTLCMAVVLGACGSSNKTQDEGTAQQTTQGAETSKPAEKVKINFPTYQVGNDGAAKWFAGFVERFNKKYEGKYEIVVEEVPGAQAFVEKLKMLNASNELPAVFDLGLDGTLASMIIKDNKIIDLKPYIDADSQWKSVLMDESVNYNTVDGKLVGAPAYLDTFSGIFYNKSLFEKAGVTEFPKTWDDFFATCDTLKKAGVTPIALQTNEDGWTSMLPMTAKLASTEEGVKFLYERFPKDFNKPYMVDAAAFLQKLFQYTTVDAIGANYAISANNFISEKAAMIANGPWMINTFNDTKTAPEGFAKKVGYSLWPGEIAHATVTRYGYAVSERFPKEVQEGAIEILKFMASPEEIRTDCVMNGRVAPKVPLTDEDKAKMDPLQVEVYGKVQNVKVPSPNYYYRWDTSVVNQALPKELPLLASGKITPEEFCKRLTETAQKFTESETK